MAEYRHYRVRQAARTVGRAGRALTPRRLCSGRTPGTGKTTHAAQLVEALQAAPTTSEAAWQHVNVGDFVKEKGCHSGYNDEWQSWDVDEDKVRLSSSFCTLRGG